MRLVMAAHQPNFLPYLGFFDKMKKADIFVIRDEVQFIERDYHHRNRILVSCDLTAIPKSKWIRVPVHKQSCDLREILLKNDVRDKNVPWHDFLLRQIKSSYHKAPFFKDYYPVLEKIFLSKKDRLADLNMEIIEYLRSCFKIRSKIVLASELNLKKTNDTNQDLVRIAKAVDAKIYLSGIGGRSYLNPKIFTQEGITVYFQKFIHPVYRQFNSKFLPNLSSIDALFCAGDVLADTAGIEREHGIKSYEVIRSNHSPSIPVTLESNSCDKQYLGLS